MACWGAVHVVVVKVALWQWTCAVVMVREGWCQCIEVDG